LNALFIPSVISTGQVDIFPLGVGVNTLTNGIYVANRGEDNVSIISRNTNTVIATVLVGDSPSGFGVNT